MNRINGVSYCNWCGYIVSSNEIVCQFQINYKNKPYLIWVGCWDCFLKQPIKTNTDTILVEVSEV